MTSRINPQSKIRAVAVRAMAVMGAALLMVAQAMAFDPAAGDFSKLSPNLIRIMTYNVHNNFIYNAETTGNYSRIIKAASPDIIMFQEMEYSLSEAAIEARLVSYFPGSAWHVHRGKSDGGVVGVNNRNVIASRFPLSRTRVDTNPGSNVRGVAIAMADLPNAAYSTNLYLMDVHFKAGGTADDHRRKQIHADAIINWMRDARTAGGNINIPTNTPMILVGDTNLPNNGDRAPYHASRTLLEGDIFDHAKYGPSSPPDWDGGDFTDAAPYDYNNGEPWTHGSFNPGGRIDRFYYTDSVIHAVSGFVLNTRTMTAAARNAAGGLLTGDTHGASDHLPVVCDFALGPNPESPGQLVINEYCANDVAIDDRTFLEIKNIGGREINLQAPVDYWLKESDPLPASAPAIENEQYAFDLAGVVPAGGLFVIYSSTNHSDGIKNLIEGRLPKLQRQDVTSFVLDNDDNSAIALVEQKMSRLNVTFETLVEAYGWGASSPDTSRYFKVDSGNNLIIELSESQWTNFLANGPSDLTVSRDFGQIAFNDYAGWSIGSPSTPGLQNAPPSNVDDWMVY